MPADPLTLLAAIALENAKSKVMVEQIQSLHGHVAQEINELRKNLEEIKGKKSDE